MTKLDMCMFRITKTPLSSCPWHLAAGEGDLAAGEGEEGPSAGGEGEEGELADGEGEEEVPACR